MGNICQGPHWMPEILNSTEPCIDVLRFFLFIHTSDQVYKLGTVRDLTTTNNEIEQL